MTAPRCQDCNQLVAEKQDLRDKLRGAYAVIAGGTRMRTVNDNHDTYSFLLDVSDFFRSLEDMGDWADRISAIADENFDPSADR